jgi:light-regulated signal transduction histidine kinase (bacteriophytochrome)
MVAANRLSGYLGHRFGMCDIEAGKMRIYSDVYEILRMTHDVKSSSKNYRAGGPDRHRDQHL